MKLVIGMTGSTGVIYGVRIMEVLKEQNVETHLVITEWAKKCLAMETDYKLDQLKALATEYSDDSNLASGISSGTYKHDRMIVVPCSMKSLSAISNGYDETLVTRAAGVTLKESRKLVLVTRETPLTAINIENMLKLARLGVVILPPVPGFYTRPKSIHEIIDHTVGKCLDQFNINHDLYKRWGS